MFARFRNFVESTMEDSGLRFLTFWLPALALSALLSPPRLYEDWWIRDIGAVGTYSWLSALILFAYAEAFRAVNIEIGLKHWRVWYALQMLYYVVPMSTTTYAVFDYSRRERDIFSDVAVGNLLVSDVFDSRSHRPRGVRVLSEARQGVVSIRQR